MARTRKIHDVAPKVGLDRFAFIATFILGVTGNIALKLIGLNPLIVVSYSAAVLVLYAVIAWMSGRVRLEPETIGDNCYYLGFLFTLSSLAFTLYQMSDATSAEGPVQIPEVISGFGVALSSTIVGVFLRVLLMQLRVDFVAKDREVRVEMDRAFTDFKREMSRMLGQMKAFSTESVQLAAERDMRLRDSTEKFAVDHMDALKAANEAQAVTMRKALEGAAKDAINEISTDLKTRTASLHEAFEKQNESTFSRLRQVSEQAAESASEREAELQKVWVDIAKKLQDITKDLEARTASLHEAFEKQNETAFGRLRQVSEKAAERAREREAEALEVWADIARKLQNTTNIVSEEGAKLEGALHASRTSFEDGAKSIEGFSIAAKNAASEIDQVFLGSLKDTQSQLSELVATLRLDARYEDASALPESVTDEVGINFRKAGGVRGENE